MSSELAAAYAAVDWAAGPLGEPDGWSPTLWSTVETVLATRFAVSLMWGPERVLVYNDAYVPMIGEKHPSALGRPAAEVFPEVWETIGPMLDTAASGTATWAQDAYIPLVRQGFLEECYFTFSYSAVRGPTGEVEGVIDIAAESTQQVVSRRRLELLSRLGYLLHDAKDRAAIVAAVLPALEAATDDFLAVDLRLPGEPGTRRTGLPATAPKATGWTGDVHDEDERGVVAWLPVSPRYAEEPMLLVARPSDQLPWDQTYERFLRLVAATIAVALERVRVLEVERDQHHVEAAAMRALQEKLLPRLSGGEVPVAVRYLPAIELAHLGGDWYDAFALPDGSGVLVMGDIMGHDEHAAAAMAEARNVLRGVAFSLEEPSPARVLAGVDRALQASDSEVMATALVMQLRRVDDGPTTLTWSSAGHPPAVVVSAAGEASLVEAAPDLVLGVDPDTDRADHELVVEPGATLVLFTDGLVERSGQALEDGLSRLLATLRGSEELTVEQVAERVVDDIVDRTDDIALLVLRA